MNEPSLRKFDAKVEPGGWIIYNGEEFPPELERKDVHVLALPFTEIADKMGNPRMTNMIMLGALLEIENMIPEACVRAALNRLIANPRWVTLDETAMDRGRQLMKEALMEV
jgi:Pyruvate/2-oxoacid:ferredoxin oxidoreductase gamma subunit